MSVESRRRTDRVSLTLLLDISGIDRLNQEFSEPAKTLMVSRHGAMIILGRDLEPEQEILIRRRAPAESHRQSRVRVVNQMGQHREGFIYSVELLDSEIDLWGVDFPAISESTEAVARMLLECTYCHQREVAYLNELEIRAFESNRGVARHCKKCNVPSIWIQVQHEQEKKVSTKSGRGRRSTEVVDAKTVDTEQRKRQRLRLQTRLTACIRRPGEDDELAVCEDISPMGICFRSKRRFDADTAIEVAVPYAPDAANIFLPARVVYSEQLPKAGLFRHGTEYRRVGPRAR
jgi:PilZ domain-containing protein